MLHGCSQVLTICSLQQPVEELFGLASIFVRTVQSIRILLGRDCRVIKETLSREYSAICIRGLRKLRIAMFPKSLLRNVPSLKCIEKGIKAFGFVTVKQCTNTQFNGKFLMSMFTGNFSKDVGEYLRDTR